MTTLKDKLNAANPQELADLLRTCKLGDLMRQALPAYLHNEDAAVDPYNLATVEVIALPVDAKAAFVFRATGKTGTTTGEFAPQAYGTTPSTGQCAVSPCGDIAFLGSDATGLLDVYYLPEQGEVYEATFTVASNAIVLPTDIASRVKLLMEAEVTAGTGTGKKIVQVPSGSAASTDSARLNLAKDTVKFDSGDAATQARVKLLLAPAAELQALLGATAPY